MGDEISWPAHLPRMLYKYLLYGETGLSEIETELRRKAQAESGGKFSKADVSYLPLPPFPLLLWDNRCKRCRFYHEGEPGKPAQCHIVGHEGEKYGGEAIHPQGWCGVYTPPKGEPAFAWIRERFDPSGATDVRGEYNPPITQKTKLRKTEKQLDKQGAIRTEQPSEAGGTAPTHSGSSTGEDDE